MTKITLEGQYQTRDGQKRRVLCVDAPGRLPVIAISQSGQVYRYHNDGRSSDDDWDQPFDLVPVTKRHKRTVWMNLGPEIIGAYDTRQGADFFAHPERIACLKLDLDFAEGEGL